MIGLGHVDCCDDAAGVAVVRRLKGRVAPRVRLVEVCQDLTTLLEVWHDAASVILIDAMRSGAEPGAVRVFDATTRPLPARAFRCTSSHALGVPEAIELARALGRLPRRLVVFGIEGVSFERECGLTPAVEAAVQDVVERVLEDVHARSFA